MQSVIFCGNEPVDNGAQCPICRGPGERVPEITVKSLVRDYCGHGVPDGRYHLCLSPDCPVVYFGPIVYSKSDLKVRVWFKEKKSPVTVCYCRGVTDQEIIKHVAERKCCCTFEEVQAHTGANTGRECLTKNPSGK